MLLGSSMLYVLSESDATLINRRRTSVAAIESRRRQNPPMWPDGAQAHVGEVVKAGTALPFIVTRATDDEKFVGGQVLLDGSDTYWVPNCAVAYDDAPAAGEAVLREDWIKHLAVGARGR